MFALVEGSQFWKRQIAELTILDTDHEEEMETGDGRGGETILSYLNYLSSPITNNDFNCQNELAQQMNN